jgi:hypothetical protein
MNVEVHAFGKRASVRLPLQQKSMIYITKIIQKAKESNKQDDPNQASPKKNKKKNGFIKPVLG